MNNKFFYLSVLATMALTANACDTGDYNDLDCDESYVSDCIAENAYMKCDLETKKLIVVQCAETESGTDKMICHQGASGARCVNEDMRANKCEADVCASDALLHKCVDGIIEPVICSGATPKCGIDATGKAACVSEGSQPGESCTETVCDTATNVIKVCVDGKVTETKRCSEDGSLICGTQGEGDAAVQACIPNPEYCDVDACGEDGKIKRCSEHRYVDAVACDPADESLRCFDVTKGEGDDAKTVGECRKSCTASACSADGKIQKCVIENDATSGYLADAVACDAENANIKCFAVTTGEGNDAITNMCKTACTTDECVSSTTLNKCHKAEGAQEGYVEVETCDTAETGKASVCMGNACKVIDKQQFIGAPCECTGTDCDVVYNKDEIESFFSEAGQTWLGTVDDASKLKEGDEIRGANFFADSTCNDLATKLGIAERDDIKIGCFRDTVVKLPTSFATLFSTEFAKRIKAQICPNGDTDDKCVVKGGETESVFDVIAKSLVAVGAVLGDGIKFTAPNGYCTMGALEMDGKLAEGNVKGSAIDIFSENAFLATPADGQASLFSRFNGGVMPSTEAGAASVCPEGSELYKYEIGKNFSESFGKATIHYALCLQKCTDDSTCREGYQCMKLTENSYKGEKADKAERSNVCFPMKNHTYMEKTLKPAFNGFMLSLFK